MELRHLRYFVAIAEELNFTRAAARLHVSQPPLSRQIQDLEHELGVTLFERGPKSVRLTPAGAALLGEARAVLQRVEEAVASVKRVRTHELKVGYAPSPTLEILPRTLRAFRKIEPEVRILMHDLSTGEMLSGLRDEKLDIALLVVDSARVPKGIRLEKLVAFPMGVLLPSDHPWSERPSIAVRDLVSEDLVAYSAKEYPDYHRFLKQLFKPTRLAPRIAAEVDGATSLVAAVASGRGLAVVAEAIRGMTSGGFSFVPLRPSPPPLVLQVATRRQHENPPMIKFLQALRETAKTLKYPCL